MISVKICAGKVRLGLVRSDQVRSGQVRSSQVRSHQDRTSRARSDKDISDSYSHPGFILMAASISSDFCSHFCAVLHFFPVINLFTCFYPYQSIKVFPWRYEYSTIETQSCRYADVILFEQNTLCTRKQKTQTEKSDLRYCIRSSSLIKQYPILEHET